MWPSRGGGRARIVSASVRGPSCAQRRRLLLSLLLSLLPLSLWLPSLLLLLRVSLLLMVFSAFLPLLSQALMPGLVGAMCVVTVAVVVVPGVRSQFGSSWSGSVPVSG